MTTTAAGHPLPIVSTPTGAVTIGRPGTLIGMFPTVAVFPERFTVDSGDVIAFYTDGITDLPTPYGITPDELVELVHRHRDRDANSIANAIHQSLLQRIADRRRRDDAAVVVLSIQ